MAVKAGPGPESAPDSAGSARSFGSASADEQAPGVDAHVDRTASGTALAGRRRPVRFVVAAAVVLAALGFLIVKGLGNATLYFKTADEAVAQRAQLGTRRFRVEGLVVGQPEKLSDGLHFTIENNNQQVSVIHTGDEPTLFQPNIPVVLEGHFAADGTYLSDRILVKHTASYTDKHPDRVKDYPPASSGNG